MPIEFYYSPSCPPCRAVMMTARALELELKLKPVDLEKKEQLKPSFLKLGPMHTVPTIVDTTGDDWLTINESRAIMCYIADKYGKDKDLFPKDLETRAIVLQRLFFDCGTLSQRFADLYFPVLLGREKSLDPEKKKKLEEAFGFFDKFLEKSPPWAAGTLMTIADFSLAATVSTAVYGPMHTVPTIVETTDSSVLAINESRAIMCYFASKFGRDKYEFLYPTDLARRAVVHQRLYFDCGTLYKRFTDAYFPVLLWGEKSLDPDKKKKLEEAFRFFDKYLEGSPPWAAGKTITIADFSLAATVSTAVACGFDLNIEAYFHVHKWFDLVKSAIKDYEKINRPGIMAFREKARKAKLIR